jgi:hypothetical protein
MIALLVLGCSALSRQDAAYVPVGTVQEPFLHTPDRMLFDSPIGVVGTGLSIARLTVGGERTFVVNGPGGTTPELDVTGPIPALYGPTFVRWLTGLDVDRYVHYQDSDLWLLEPPGFDVRSMRALDAGGAHGDGAAIGRPGDVLLERDDGVHAAQAPEQQVPIFLPDAGLRSGGLTVHPGHGASIQTWERTRNELVWITHEGWIGQPWSLRRDGYVQHAGSFGPDGETAALFLEYAGGTPATRIVVLTEPAAGGDIEDATTVFADPPASRSYTLGRSATSGDFDGDGITDLALSNLDLGPVSPLDPDGSPPGQVLIYRGPLEPDRTYTSLDADLTFTLADPGVVGFGHTLLAEDLDGDGIAELAVTAPESFGGAGAAFVFDDPLGPWLDANGRR